MAWFGKASATGALQSVAPFRLTGLCHRCSWSEFVSPVHDRACAAIFTADSIKDLLSNPRYAGRVPLRDGRVVAGTFPALVSVETFEACEKIRSSQRFKVKREPGSGKVGSAYLLSGLLRCAECGSTMSGNRWMPDRTHPLPRSFYTCYRRRVAAGCDAPTIPQDVVEGDLLAVLRTMALPPGFARAVDSAVAARMRTFGKAELVSESTLTERQRRINEMYKLERITKAEYDAECRKIDQQRSTLRERPAPLFTQQQSVLRSLVDKWGGMTGDEKKQMLAAIFDSITASADGVDRLEPCEDWRPYIVAAIPSPVRLATERKTGLEPATPVPRGVMTDEWLEVRRAA